MAQKSRFANVANGIARNDCDAVIALLAVDRDMGITRVPERAEGEIAVRTFRLLQAQNIRPVLGEVTDDKSMRRRTELMFHVAIENVMSGSGRRRPLLARPEREAQASLDHCPQARSHFRRLPG